MNLKPYTTEIARIMTLKFFKKIYKSSPGLLITPSKNQTLLGFI